MAFIEPEDGLVIVPVVPLESLIRKEETDRVTKLIHELESERRNAAKADDF